MSYTTNRFNDILKPTKLRKFKGKIYGFDIETYDNNKKFLMCSIFDNKDKYWVFYKKDDLINFIKKKRFWNSIIAATNLSFDFFGTFFKKEEIKEFNLLFRGSSLIYARTYIKNKQFNKRSHELKDGKRSGKQGQRLVFLDTMNYSQLSVEKLGKLLNIKKLKSPSFLGQYPKNKKQWEEMKVYNIRDSEISKLYLEFLYDTFYKLGASHKLTIASTSMSLFRNRYMKDIYYRHDVDELLDQFKAYYGGRVEAFSRGKIKDYNYYDFNSLYPDVMRNDYPDPNSKRITHKNTLRYINEFEGISDVDVFCPDMEYPLLPFRTENKLMFPCGNFRGWYSHVELRKAIEIGYTIKKVYKTYYFKWNCSPFKNIVNDLYKKRLEYQNQGSSMEYVTKILLNSLYGKFGQKFIDRDNWMPFNHTLEELNKLKYFERFGDFIRIKRPFSEPSAFCIPIWALYTTAYARLKLYDAIVKYNPVYVDTDSLITKKTISTSKALGGLKLEMPVKFGVIVKPKFYALVDKDDNEYVKIKGLGTRLNFNQFNDLLYDPVAQYKKFMKFKESIRRGFIPNEIVDIKKEMDLNDNKRLWNSRFNPLEFQKSWSIYHDPEKKEKSINRSISLINNVKNNG